MNNSQITHILQSIFDTKNINTISNQTGINKFDTKNIMLEALPQILNGLNSNLVDEKNINSLYATLDKHIGVNLRDGISIQEGEKILNHIFSNPKNVSSHISKITGANKNESFGVLSSLAPIVMNILGTQKSRGAGKKDIVGLINNLSNQANSGMMLAIFDKNKNGKINDDIFSMVIGFFKNLFFGKK